MAKRISAEIRDEVLKRIKDEGKSVLQLSKEYGISESAIYSWLDRNTNDASGSSQLEINRLKRENQDLRELIGQLVYEKEKQKKQKQQGR